MEDPMSDELKRLVAETLKSAETEWWTRTLTNSYKWLGAEEIYWIIDTETDKSVMAIRLKDGSYAQLNCSGGVPIISKVIAANLGNDAIEKLGTEDFALLLVEWRSDPRACVATPRFLQKEESTLDSWLMGTETEPQALRDICLDPIFKKDIYGSWSLTFNSINRNGGVEQWTAAGQSANFAINSIEIRTIKENDTFYYPYEL